jgi:syntaxin-binding protein 5
MLGELFLPCDTPEAPKQSFFKNLFGPSTNTLDREELCMIIFSPLEVWFTALFTLLPVGEEGSGKASKTIAKYTAGMASAQERVAGGCSEISKAKMVGLVLLHLLI